ncbi:MAG: Bax inhibitor-1/YccA family protein [Candidatus Dasytiphilus stammeri]
MEHNHQRSDSIIHHRETSIPVYITHVYGWMSCGLLLTAFVSWYVANSWAVLAFIFSNRVNLFLLVILQLGIVLILSSMVHKMSGTMATGLFLLYSILTGITLSSIFLFYSYLTIASTFLITSGMFGAMTLWGYITKRNLTSIGSILLMALVGLLLASIVNTWLHSTTIMRSISYFGVVIFVGLISWDTQKLKNISHQIDESNPEILRRYAIMGALTLYLDFVNLFVMLMRILSNRR